MTMKTALIILDGVGISGLEKNNPIFFANTPALDFLLSKNPFVLLEASQEAVGLPWGEPGNSEVGHYNLGTGNLNWQSQEMINQSIKDGSFFKNPSFLEAINWVKEKNSKLHLIGLASDGGVHSHINHLFALIRLAKKEGIQRKKLFVHCFADGRDTPPKIAETHLQLIEKELKDIGEIASISGRYYAMDRDNHWERTILAYNAMVEGKGRGALNYSEALRYAYENEESDEFITPTAIVDKNQIPKAKIEENDAIIFFNFRADRARQLTKLFLSTDPSLPKRKILKNILFVTMTPYETDWKISNLKTAFSVKAPGETLSSLISKNNLSQLHLAESEKYAHVTYFFNGGYASPSVKETQIVVPSPRVATYDQKPEMSAFLVSQKLKELCSKLNFDFIVLNFANGDMVGHTGNFQAIIKAIEAVDLNLKEIIQFLKEKGYQIFITADHGNAEQAINLETGEIDKEHTINPVFFIKVIEWDKKYLFSNQNLHKNIWTKTSLELKKGVLADVTATIARSLNLNSSLFSGDVLLV